MATLVSTCNDCGHYLPGESWEAQYHIPGACHLCHRRYHRAEDGRDNGIVPQSRDWPPPGYELRQPLKITPEPSPAHRQVIEDLWRDGQTEQIKKLLAAKNGNGNGHAPALPAPASSPVQEEVRKLLNQALTTECSHLGLITDETSLCESCGSDEQGVLRGRPLPVITCKVHKKCTTDYKARDPDVKWCKTCQDHPLRKKAMALLEKEKLNREAGTLLNGLRLAPTPALPAPAMPAAASLITHHSKLITPVRDLIMHVYPVEGNGAWQRNIGHILKRIHLFNGKRICAIATTRPGIGLPTAVREQFPYLDSRGSMAKLDSPESVEAVLRPHGFEFIRVPNNPNLGEVTSFPLLLEKIESQDPDRVFLYCHAKGTSRPSSHGSHLHEWTDILYETLLDYWPVVEWELKHHPLAGTFKKSGRGFDGSESRWHYSGAFFWARSKNVFSRNWKQVDKIWGGAESWPGVHFQEHEGGTVFHGGGPHVNLYDVNYLNATVKPSLELWRGMHAHEKTDWSESVSVLVPCYNPNLTWMEQTLRSIHEQLDPIRDEIVVVDDCSSNGEAIRELSERYGARYLRNETEQGGVKSHNIAIREAKRELVHLIHPDDTVLPGFYDAVRQTMRDHPEVALCATRAILMSHDGQPNGVTSADWLRGEKMFQPIHEGNPLRVPAVVVRRSAYENHGGWNEELIHVSDWETWVRMVTLGGGVAIDKPLACYRMHPANHSSRLQLTGENWRDTLRMGRIVDRYAPVKWDAFQATVVNAWRSQESMFRAAGDLEAAEANRLAAESLVLLPWRDVSLGKGAISTSLTVRETETLQELTAGKTVLEIGSAFGYSTIAMALVARRVVSIDHHRDHPDSLEKLRKNLEEYGVTDKVKVLVGESVQILPALTEKFDLVFIDADHSLEAVMSDIELSERLVSAGGMMALHDYGEENCPGVKIAVDRVFDQRVKLVDTLCVVEVPRPLSECGHDTGHGTEESAFVI